MPTPDAGPWAPHGLGMPLTPSAEKTCWACHRACTRDPIHRLRREAPPATRDSVLCCRARASSGSSGRHPHQPKELRFHIKPQPSAPAGARHLRFGLSPLGSPSKGGFCFCFISTGFSGSFLMSRIIDMFQQRVLSMSLTCSRNSIG